MKRNFLSGSSEALFPEITPGPIDTLVIRAVTLVMFGCQKALQAVRGWKRQSEPVYIDIRAIRNKRAADSRE